MGCGASRAPAVEDVAGPLSPTPQSDSKGHQQQPKQTTGSAAQVVPAFQDVEDDAKSVAALSVGLPPVPSPQAAASVRSAYANANANANALPARLALAHSKLKRRYDCIVVGSGYGGSIAALRAAQHGKTVAVLELGKVRSGSEAVGDGEEPLHWP
jgi:hypothetical protein